MLQPLYTRKRPFWISFCTILYDVASCVLYFSSISVFWRVFHCAKSDRGFWASIPAINNRKQFIAMWLPFERHEFYCRPANSRLVQWESMIANMERTKSHFSPIKHLSVTSLRLNCCYTFFLFKKIKYVHASVQARRWPFLIFV
jgi:hypothetical protein